MDSKQRRKHVGKPSAAARSSQTAAVATNRWQEQVRYSTSPSRRLIVFVFAHHYRILQPDILHDRLRNAESRILHLELRNRATLDALDDVQSAAATEVDLLRRDLERSQQRCVLLAEASARAQRERDEMNDVVMLLIKKGGIVSSNSVQH